MVKKWGRKAKRKKDRKNSALNYKRTNKHHIVSRAIGGPDVSKNLYNCLIKWHNAWHQLFGTYLPSIAIVIIKEWTKPNCELYEEKIGKKNLKAWKIVFQEKTPQEAIHFVEAEFLPIEKKFLAGELIDNKNGQKHKKYNKINPA